MKAFKTLDESHPFNQDSFQDIPLGELPNKPIGVLKNNIDYWTTITNNSQPHPIFNLDWASYSSMSFADTFLPSVASYQGKGSYLFDGAALFTGLRKTARKLFAFIDSTKLITLVSYTYPKGVFSEKRKDRVQPSDHEVCQFVEIDENGSIEISFKFGKAFKETLSDIELKKQLIHEL